MTFPRIVRLRPNLYALVFELLKIVPAKYVIEKAIAAGRVRPSTTVAETSSGTYALGMAIVCAENNLRFAIFSDPAIDDDLKRRLQDLGGIVHIFDAGPHENPQQKRLAGLRDFLAKNDAYWPRQYDNPENREAYHDVARYIRESLDRPLHLVGTVGSGSSTCGLIEGLRRIDPGARLIGVDTFNSVLFGLPNGKRILRGLGNSLQPENLVHEYFDDVHWLDHHVAYAYTRKLHREHAIFAGPTSGAAYAVALHLAESNPDETYAFVAADSGHRYMRCAYAQELPARGSAEDAAIAYRPARVESPGAARGAWSWMAWGRRSLAAAAEAEAGR